MGLTTLLPETRCGLANRNGYGAWHRYGSQSVHYLNDEPLVYHCTGAIKPGVAIKRSNLVSRNKDSAPAIRGLFRFREVIPGLFLSDL
jgi:hypothetical protein